MATQKFEFTYGEGKIALEFDEEFLAGPQVKPRPLTSNSRLLSEIIQKAIDNPINRPKLRDMVNGKYAGIVVSDELRVGLQEEIISSLLQEVIKGKPRKTIVAVATGAHDPRVYSQNICNWIKKYATTYFLNYEIIVNDCNHGDFIHIGNTERKTPLHISKKWLTTEVRVYGHEAKYHYMNGYSCIDKQILPGLSSKLTIEANHKLALFHNDAVAGKNPWHKDPARRNNPFAQDTRQARQISETCFYNEQTGLLEKKEILTFGLDMVSEKNKILWIAAGDPDIVSQEMTEAVDRLTGFEVEKTRYVVISPGGPPPCQTMYGTQNCFDLALKGAILDGGEALVISPCQGGEEEIHPEARGLAPDLKSKKLFWDTLIAFKDRPLSDWLDFVDRSFQLYLWKTDRVLKLFKENKIKIYVYSKIKKEILAQAGFIGIDDPQEWINERAKRNDGKIRLIDVGNKILVRGL